MYCISNCITIKRYIINVLITTRCKTCTSGHAILSSMTEDEEEDVSSYWKSKHYTALRGELAVEEAAYLSEDKLKNELSER